MAVNLRKTVINKVREYVRKHPNQDIEDLIYQSRISFLHLIYDRTKDTQTQKRQYLELIANAAVAEYNLQKSQEQINKLSDGFTLSSQMLSTTPCRY
jgi:hypothetical protein